MKIPRKIFWGIFFVADYFSGISLRSTLKPWAMNAIAATTTNPENAMKTIMVLYQSDELSDTEFSVDLYRLDEQAVFFAL